MKAKLLQISLLFTFTFLFLGSSVLATDDTSTASTPEATRTPKFENNYEQGRFINRLENKFSDKVSPGPTSKPEKSPDTEGRKRLSELKLKACEAREEVIKKRNENLMSLVVKMVGKFDAIAVRVEEFYTGKLLPKGKVLSNYDALVSEINTKKAILDSALKSVPDTADFDCSGEDPKGLLTEYRSKMQDVKTALHNYRTSIKNLIVAVHSLVENGDKRESPKPSASPET